MLSSFLSVSDEERAYLATLRPSRIREVQAGRSGWTYIDVIDVESGEAVALRGVLELFGVRVRCFPVGQARHLLRALGGDANAPCVVLACHGDGCETVTELASAFFGGGATAYVASRGAPFGYASAFAPLLLFYELTEGRSLELAVKRLREHDGELAMWRLFRP